MYSFDEAVDEFDQKEKEAAKDERVDIIRRSLSFKPSVKLTPNLFQGPSFFKRLLSVKALQKVAAEEGHEEIKDVIFQTLDEDEEEKEESSNQDGSTSENDEDSNSNNSEKVEEQKLKNEYVYDPPMPKIGKPLIIDLLITRNKRAESGLYSLMEMVNKNVNDSVKDAKQIPVINSIDRVSVTQEASDRMAKVRKKRDIERTVDNNMHEIQRALNYRKSALIMMNSNYSRALVRKIEPIYIQEARSILEPKDTIT